MNNNNESLLVLKKCRQRNKSRKRLWEQLDNLLTIHDGFDCLIIQDAQQCNRLRVVVTLSVLRNRGSQLDAPVAKSSCWTAPKRKVMFVSVTDIFMRQVKFMELLSSPGPSAEFQQKTHGSHLRFISWCMIYPRCKVGLIEKRIQVPWSKTDLTALICVPWFMELL